VKSGISDGIQQRLAEFVGVDEPSLPTVRILDPSDNMKKYTFGEDVSKLSVESLKKFIDEFKNGKLAPFLKSQDIPADNSEPVKVVVGKSFNSIVMNNEDDVLMEFYAPWCGHCKKLEPIYTQLAEELKDVKNLVIAKMDSTANEVEGVEVRGYPTLKFYPKDGKKAPVDYDGERDLEGFKKYLSEKSASFKKHVESKTEL